MQSLTVVVPRDVEPFRIRTARSGTQTDIMRKVFSYTLSYAPITLKMSQLCRRTVVHKGTLKLEATPSLLQKLV